MDILSRLPVKYIIQSRLVSRYWGLLSRDPHLFHMHISRSPGFKFLFLHCTDFYGSPNGLHFVEFSDYENELVSKIEEPFPCFMPKSIMIASCNGLLCLVGIDSGFICIYSPFTRGYNVVPELLDSKYSHILRGFGCHPITREYKLISVGYRRKNDGDIRAAKSDVQVYSLSKNAWRSTGKLPYKLDRSSGVLLGGRLHWLSDWRLWRRGLSNSFPGIVSFDLADDSFKKVPMPSKVICRRGLGSAQLAVFRRGLAAQLAVLGGCLSIAVRKLYPTRRVQIWVMKEYGVKKSWVKQYSLRDGFLKFDPCWRSNIGGRLVRILCLHNNGEILLDYKGEALVSYNCFTKICKKVTFGGTLPMSPFKVTLDAIS